MLTSGTASLILPGCSWTAIQALAARLLPPLICDQLTLPKAAPLTPLQAREVNFPILSVAPSGLAALWADELLLLQQGEIRYRVI